MLGKKQLKVFAATALIGQFAAADIVFARAGETGSTAVADPLWLLAQTTSTASTLNYPYSYSDEPADSNGNPAYLLAFEDANTRALIRFIEDGTRDCSSAPPGYRIDCLAAVFVRADAAVAGRPDYAVAVSELRSLSRKLKRIVGKNVDRSAPKYSKGRRNYRAVAKAALRRANAEAAAAIDESVTRLLRSAGNSQKRKVHYTRIARAVGSTKRILRS